MEIRKTVGPRPHPNPKSKKVCTKEKLRGGKKKKILYRKDEGFPNSFKLRNVVTSS